MKSNTAWRLWGFIVALTVTPSCDSGDHTLAWLRSDAGTDELTPLPWYGGPSYHEPWEHGYPTDVDFFPIGVWMQSPSNAARFQAVGVNHYIGLWEGPTEEQLAAMTAANMPVLCEQAGVWQEHLDNPGIQGWFGSAGPDNAQENPDGSYSPCIEPAVVQARYTEIHAADPTRPVLVLLGQGVATPDWEGRGECTGRTSDYPQYAAASDILLNYTYPLNNGHALELVATGIDNLNRYANYSKPIIADIEASNIDGNVRPTPHQLRAEVWLSLIHGAASIAWFCHRFSPDFSEVDCLEDQATAEAMTQIAAELQSLAPALNSQSYRLDPRSTVEDAKVAAVVKRVGREHYVFAASMTAQPTSARFSLRGIPNLSRIQVLSEGRDVEIDGDNFEDSFEGYDVHLYRLR